MITKPPRINDSQKTREDILAVALEEFSTHGLAGARVDTIAARTKTTKRMIYYYFKDKEGLYLATLERAYAEIREAEERLDTTDLSPSEAIRRIVEFTFDYNEAHTGFTRMVGMENIHFARLLKTSAITATISEGILARLKQILSDGRRLGSFRRTVSPLDLHMLITSFCYFRISNQHTFELVFAVKLRAPATRRRHRAMACDAVLAYLTSA
ncbi:TetR family transcriptional regulator [Beijerinckia sp. L45]|uniref:TetR family transcriptional regulator n=1 Tax=Beijerinckia sp. L45 TaxID=1641855 RepID=UPI00131DC580|nr:TetR family transcriptional regulator [Beijerinckia sp. L45]